MRFFAINMASCVAVPAKPPKGRSIVTGFWYRIYNITTYYLDQETWFIYFFQEPYLTKCLFLRTCQRCGVFLLMRFVKETTLVDMCLAEEYYGMSALLPSITDYPRWTVPIWWGNWQFQLPSPSPDSPHWSIPLISTTPRQQCSHRPNDRASIASSLLTVLT